MDKAVAPTEDTPLYSQERFWNGLLIIAIVLTVFAIFSSELGLDAHVEGAYVESENGWVLDWGDVRTEDPLASDCLLYTSPSPRDATLSRMPSSA